MLSSFLEAIELERGRVDHEPFGNDVVHRSQISLHIDGRELSKFVTSELLKRAARGPSSLIPSTSPGNPRES